METRCGGVRLLAWTWRKKGGDDEGRSKEEEEGEYRGGGGFLLNTLRSPFPRFLLLRLCPAHLLPPCLPPSLSSIGMPPPFPPPGFYTLPRGGGDVKCLEER